MRMKITVMPPLLLLLVCSVSTGPTTTDTGKEPAAQSSLQDIHAVLRELTVLLAQQKVAIASLPKQNQVAFSASLLAEGVFTAPVRGVYHFDWHIAQYANALHATGVDLMKSSDRVFMAYEQNTFGFGSSSNGVNLFLEVGESVYLRLWKSTTLFDNQSHHTTFSGHLLFPM
ncbi:complement C1q-like protein 4 [Anabas testudineus]|uniref:complement C1q-like protein 4 n=1 Tax=Anabas testudineus TaxID=64144 RepID=UPI000E45B54D|nr:complement C1q-like protein 4 [Anabas testudineus]